jgi:hypothetical protein
LIETAIRHGNISREKAIGLVLLGELSRILFYEHVECELPGDEDISIVNYKKEIDSYCIGDSWYEEPYLYISTARPGVLIGCRGSNIYKLESSIIEFADEHGLPLLGIKLKEDKDPFINYLYKGWYSYQMRHDYNYSDI